MAARRRHRGALGHRDQVALRAPPPPRSLRTRARAKPNRRAWSNMKIRGRGREAIAWPVTGPAANHPGPGAAVRRPARAPRQRTRRRTGLTAGPAGSGTRRIPRAGGRPGTTMHEPTMGRIAASATLPGSKTSAPACWISGGTWSRPWRARPTCSSDPRSWLTSTLRARRPGVAPTARRSSARTPSTPATPRDAAVRPPAAGARTDTAGSVAEGARTRRRVLRDRQLADRGPQRAGAGAPTGPLVERSRPRPEGPRPHARERPDDGARRETRAAAPNPARERQRLTATHSTARRTICPAPRSSDL